MLFQSIRDYFKLHTPAKRSDSSISSERWKWLDIMKGIAILAVITDHLCFSFIDIKICSNIQKYTFFSVGLFVFLAGITAAMSYEKHSDASLQGVFKRLPHILIPYVYATFFFNLITHGKHFYLSAFLTDLFQFKACQVFYFVFFFLQLMFIAPILYDQIIKRQSDPVIRIPAVFLLLTGIAFWSTFYTKMLPLHGGGQHLLGGFYLLNFALGMLFYRFKEWFGKWTVSGSFFILFSAVYIFLRLIPESNLKGKTAVVLLSINPNGVMYAAYSFLVFFGLLCCFCGLDAMRNHAARKKTGDFIVRLLFPLEVCGKYSYVIFLFHMIPVRFTEKYYKTDLSGKVPLAAVFLTCLLVTPVFCILLGWIGKKIRKSLF